MIKRTVYKEIGIDIDLQDFKNEDLIEELKLRGIILDTVDDDLLNQIYEKRRLLIDYQLELEHLIYKRLGKVL